MRQSHFGKSFPGGAKIKAPGRRSRVTQSLPAAHAGDRASVTPLHARNRVTQSDDFVTSGNRHRVSLRRADERTIGYARYLENRRVGIRRIR